MPARRYNIFTQSKTGYIDVDGENVTYSLDRTFQTKQSYVQSIEKTGDMALSKCSAKMSYYSLMGDLQSVEFIINQNELLGLKKTLGK